MQTSNISFTDSRYPDSLRVLEDAPKSINVMGELPKSHLVAIVGTRKCTPYGERMAYHLASELAKAGAVIVSGLALGIDGIAHRAALDAGGRTIAVVGHGLANMYPSSHRALADEIVQSGGAIISEYDHHVPPEKFRFPERNRIIAALCEATIVVESPIQGGSLITAAKALDLNRIVMAVPGNVTAATSAGTNSLIRSGAIFIRSASDAMLELGFLMRDTVPVPAKSKDEATLLELIEAGATTSDALIQRSGLSPSQFANIISLMEITGKVRNLGAGNWVVR